MSTFLQKDINVECSAAAESLNLSHCIDVVLQILVREGSDDSLEAEIDDFWNPETGDSFKLPEPYNGWMWEEFRAAADRYIELNESELRADLKEARLETLAEEREGYRE